MTRALALATALLFTSLPHVPTAQAADPVHFWDLQPRSLRLLVSSPQVMVTRTADRMGRLLPLPGGSRPVRDPRGDEEGYRGC